MAFVSNNKHLPLRVFCDTVCKMIKEFIRFLYWKFAHKGDSWQTRLVVYYFGELKKINGEVPSGHYLFTEIHRIHGLQYIGHTHLPKISGTISANAAGLK